MQLGVFGRVNRSAGLSVFFVLRKKVEEEEENDNDY